MNKESQDEWGELPRQGVNCRANDCRRWALCAIIPAQIILFGGFCFICRAVTERFRFSDEEVSG